MNEEQSMVRCMCCNAHVLNGVMLDNGDTGPLCMDCAEQKAWRVTDDGTAVVEGIDAMSKPARCVAVSPSPHSWTAKDRAMIAAAPRMLGLLRTVVNKGPKNEIRMEARAILEEILNP